MFKRLMTSKTAWAAMLGILTAIGAGATGEMGWMDVGKVAFPAILALFLRDGIAKK